MEWSAPTCPLHTPDLLHRAGRSTHGRPQRQGLRMRPWPHLPHIPQALRLEVELLHARAGDARRALHQQGAGGAHRHAVDLNLLALAIHLARQGLEAEALNAWVARSSVTRCKGYLGAARVNRTVPFFTSVITNPAIQQMLGTAVEHACCQLRAARHPGSRITHLHPLPCAVAPQPTPRSDFHPW